MKELSEVLTALGFSDQDKSIVLALHSNRSYTKTAEALELTVGRVKHRFFSACKILDGDPRVAKLVARLLKEAA